VRAALRYRLCVLVVAVAAVFPVYVWVDSCCRIGHDVLQRKLVGRFVHCVVLSLARVVLAVLAAGVNRACHCPPSAPSAVAVRCRLMVSGACGAMMYTVM
jgi:hypothetical protein